MTLDPSLLIVSFLVGLLVGSTSMGGAALMTPILILFMNVTPVFAVGTDLVYGAITKIVGAAMHWRMGTVDLRVVRQLAAGSLPGGIFGVLLITFLHRKGWAVDVHVRHALGAVLVLVAAVLLARSFGLQIPNPFQCALDRHRPWGVTLWGAVVGIAVGMTSVGSGSLITPFLLMIFPLDPARVVGTDVFHAAALVTVTAAVYSGAGFVDWLLIPIMLAGSIPGVLIGSYVAPRLPERPLRIGLSLVLLATGLRLA